MTDAKLDRRKFLQLAGATGVAASLAAKTALLRGETAAYQPTWSSLDARPMPEWFTRDKFGIFIHWGVYSVPAYAPVLPGQIAYAEWYWHQMLAGRDNPKASELEKGTWEFHQKWYGADFPYQNFAPQFRAELFDADAWAKAIAGSGARYVALTSKHHDGFALWPSKEASSSWGRPWNATEIGPKRDLVGELTHAVRQANVRMGLYYSLYEWYSPLWLSDKPRFVREHTIPQFKDLVTRYQPDIIFSDGDWEMSSAEWHSPELLAWLYNESPVKDKVVVNDRWGSDCPNKHGGYWATEYSTGATGAYHPWEECRGMGVSFGLNRAERLTNYHTGQELVLMLADIVSRGGNLLLDIGPAADGTIPVVMEDRLHQMGSWLRINGEAIYETSPWKVTRQWGEGKVPVAGTDKKAGVDFSIVRLASHPEPGEARLEALFTGKQGKLYAILPTWPGATFHLKDVPEVRAATLLGFAEPLKFHASGNGITITLPILPDELLRQPAWTLRLEV